MLIPQEKIYRPLPHPKIFSDSFPKRVGVKKGCVLRLYCYIQCIQNIILRSLN